MINKKLNINHIMKSILAVFFMVCILISSCAVKYGIKNLFNLQSPAKSHTFVPKEKFMANATVTCNFCKDKEITAKSDTPLSVSDFQELTALAVILFSGAFLVLKLRKHPFYGTSKAGNTVPIFIQYRKLII